MKRTLSGCTLLLAGALVWGNAGRAQETNPHELFQQTQAGSTLTLDQLETVLESLQLKPVTNVQESGEMFLQIVCNDGKADLDVTVSISGDGKKILMSTALVVGLEVEAIRPDQWAALMRTANSHRADNFYLQEKPFLLGIRRCFDNRFLDAGTVKYELEGFLDSIVHFRPAWEPIWRMATQQAEAAAPVHPESEPALRANSIVTERPTFLFSSPASNNGASEPAIARAIELWKNRNREVHVITGGVWRETGSDGSITEWEFFDGGRARFTIADSGDSVRGVQCEYVISETTLKIICGGGTTTFELEWLDSQTLQLSDSFEKHLFRRLPGGEGGKIDFQILK